MILKLFFTTPPEELTIEIFTVTGKLIFRKDFTEYAGQNNSVTELQNREQGIYFIRIKTGTGVYCTENHQNKKLIMTEKLSLTELQLIIRDSLYHGSCLICIG